MSDWPTAGEEWLPVRDFAGKYEVSSAGRVRIVKSPKGQRLVPQKIHQRYPRVSLWDGTTTRNVYVHRLVAEAFLGAQPPGEFVRHLDGDHENNTAGNLAWGTRSENMLDSVRHGTHFEASKVRCDNGHEFFGTNLLVSGGQRYCRICMRRQKVCPTCGRSILVSNLARHARRRDHADATDALNEGEKA